MICCVFQRVDSAKNNNKDIFFYDIDIPIVAMSVLKVKSLFFIVIFSIYNKNYTDIST